MSIVAPVAVRLRQIPVGAWFGLTVILCLMALVWHRFCLDPEDRSWLDPGQPPLNVDVDMRTTVAAVLPPPFRAPKPYPYDTLAQHPGCWVGDC